MNARPEQWGRVHAEAFLDASVAREYRHRPTYARAAIEFVASRCVAEVRVALDLGAGTGFVARALAPSMTRVDAVDMSAAMIAEGRAAADGDDPRIRWIVARAEDAPLDGPYGIATAGDSLHWMEWDIVLPRVRQALAPGAKLVILETVTEPYPDDDPITDLLRRYSVYGPTFKRIDLLEELEKRRLFRREGGRKFGEAWRTDRDTFIASFHARSSLSVARIGTEKAAAFDRELARLVERDPDRYLARELSTGVVWGTPW